MPMLFPSFAPGGYAEYCGTGNVVQRMYFVLVILAVELCVHLKSIFGEDLYMLLECPYLVTDSCV